MLLRSVANMAGAGRGTRLLPRDAVLVIVTAEPLALVFQKASLSDNDPLPACPPPLAHDGPLFRDSLLVGAPHGACDTTQLRPSGRSHYAAGRRPHPSSL